jgi:hypothetical protein
MQRDPIEFRGSYRYATITDLERALAAARDHIADDELGDGDADWMRSFTTAGTVLRVTARLPIATDRFVAAAVFDTLAAAAVEGVVEASCGGRRLDWFPSKGI